MTQKGHQQSATPVGRGAMDEEPGGVDAKEYLPCFVRPFSMGQRTSGGHGGRVQLSLVETSNEAALHRMTVAIWISEIWNRPAVLVEGGAGPVDRVIRSGWRARETAYGVLCQGLKASRRSGGEELHGV